MAKKLYEAVAFVDSGISYPEVLCEDSRVFADSEPEAEKIFLIANAEILRKHIIGEVTVLVRPFA